MMQGTMRLIKNINIYLCRQISNTKVKQLKKRTEICDSAEQSLKNKEKQLILHFLVFHTLENVALCGNNMALSSLKRII
jgi:hypothetical protein